MLRCDTCDTLPHPNHTPAPPVYTTNGLTCLVVCGDCHADITADNIRTDDSEGSQLLNALISRSPDTSIATVSGSFLGAWF